MQQKKERLRTAIGDPSLRDCFGLAAGPLHFSLRFASAHFHVVVVEVEGVADAGRGAENVRRHRGAGGVAVLLQQRRHRLVLRRIERISNVVAHSVVRRKRTGEHRDVRWQRERNVCIRVLEENRIGAKAIDVRRLDLLVSVRREMIGAQGVDGDDDDRRIGIDMCRRFAAMARRKRICSLSQPCLT